MVSSTILRESVDLAMDYAKHDHDSAPADDPATVSLTETQNPYIIKSPSRTTLEWRRIDPSLNTAVAPLLKKPLVPFQRSEKAKAYKAAVYYSECFLRGITPNDADNAAVDIDSQYQKWWVESTYRDEDPGDGKAVARASDSMSLSSLKRKYNDDHSTTKRSRQRGGMLDVIDAVTADGFYPTNADDPTQVSHGHTKVNEPQDVARVGGVSAEDKIEHHVIDPFAVQDIPNLSSVSVQQIEGIRDEVILKLRENKGNVDDPIVKTGLSILESYYLRSDIDARRVDDDDFPYDSDGTWLTLSRPTYSESRGENSRGESVYSLGRMSFDMFRPSNLQCSIQGIFNTVQLLDPAKGELPYSMPRQIRKELGKSLTEGVKGLRTYKYVSSCDSVLSLMTPFKNAPHTVMPLQYYSRIDN